MPVQHKVGKQREVHLGRARYASEPVRVISFAARWITRFTVGALVFLLVLFLVDRALGLSGLGPVLKPVNEMGMAAGLNEMGTRLRPGFRGTYTTAEFSIGIEINEQGLRGAAVRTPKPRDTFRILALGDSFTFGQGVEADQAWPHLVSGLVDGAQRVEVVNAGWAAPGPRGQARYLESRGVAFEPDLVLMAFFVGNDVLDDLADVYAGPQTVDQLAFEAQYLTNLRIRFGLLGAFREVADTLYPNLYERLTLAAVKVQYVLGSHRNHFDYVLSDDEPADLREGWGLSLEALERMARTSAARGARFGIVVVPFYDQLSGLSAGPGRTIDRPQKRLAEFCRAGRIACLDLLPVLAEAGEQASLYYLKDGHWTVRGQQIAARAIADWVLREGLVPGADR